MKIHEAQFEDIKQLAVHHKKMFEEIWEQKSQKLDAAKAQEVEQAYIDKLEKQIPDGSCKAWVVRNGNQVIASGAITIVSYVPVPYDTNLNIAYLHSMYTEKEFRGRECARQIIEKAIQYCKENGINRIFLNASAAGKPVYEKTGFSPSPEAMRLLIK
ncbi:GNAT family N-acetyltransferase [Thermodesulfobacteriota bacterium]